MPSPVCRCAWARGPLDIIYHDTEWGVPQHDDRILFELLILEGAQAGLSWSTILKKRASYRAAFDHFDARQIDKYDDRKVAALLADPRAAGREKAGLTQSAASHRAEFVR